MIITLHKKMRATLRYAFQPGSTLSFDGDGVRSGKVTLYPMEDGSYHPPAQAHFSFKQDRIVGSSGVLDIGIELDQKGDKVFFGGSRGRFDHCTDLGVIPFNTLVAVDPAKLDHRREDTPLQLGHSYVYESNIYRATGVPASAGSELCYAKILVEAIEEVAPEREGKP
jgi:hypothetical protein